MSDRKRLDPTMYSWELNREFDRSYQIRHKFVEEPRDILRDVFMLAAHKTKFINKRSWEIHW